MYVSKRVASIVLRKYNILDKDKRNNVAKCRNHDSIVILHVRATNRKWMRVH